MKAIKATYENGKVTLAERPSEPGPMEVLVVFPEAADDRWREILQERRLRPAFAKFAEKCLKEIKKGKAKPFKLDDL